MTPGIMLNPVKSFADMSLKVVAVRAAGDSDLEFVLPVSGPETTPSALTIPLGFLMQHHPSLFSDTEAWHHGGLNE